MSWERLFQPFLDERLVALSFPVDFCQNAGRRFSPTTSISPPEGGGFLIRQNFINNLDCTQTTRISIHYMYKIILETFSSFVPLLSDMLWVTLIAAILFVYKKNVLSFADAIIGRIQRGADMRFGPLSIGAPPPHLDEHDGAGVAVFKTLETVDTEETPSKESIDRQYSVLLAQGYYLLHATQVIRDRTTPKSGRFRVRVWVEAKSGTMDDITQVTYRVWDDFQNPVITTKSKETCFDLWLSIYGEFPVLAYIERKNKPGIFIMRYLDLPGRPQD